MNIRSTSTPAGILIPASCSHVAIGSDQAWISKVHAPPTSGVTQASYRSGIDSCLVIRTGGRGCRRGR